MSSPLNRVRSAVIRDYERELATPKAGRSPWETAKASGREQALLQVLGYIADEVELWWITPSS